MLKKQFVFLIAIIAMTVNVSAEHLVGGEIYYECLGGDQYLITLKVYRDCFSAGAPFDNPASIAVYNSSGGLITTLQAPYSGSELLEVVINNPCLQAPPNICVEEAIYTVTATLPFISGGYHIAYQRCCRNETIVNLVNPGVQGSTYYVQIPEEALNTCNSSPYFNGFPPLALCIGDELIFDHSASDPDDDQLVYSLCTPYHGGTQLDPAPIPAASPPYTFINWGATYGSTYQIDAAPQLSVDPTTGLLTGVPTQAGQYVVGVCVEEYRNGVLISVNKRDFQFNVVNCSSNVEAIIPSQSLFHDPCSGLEVNFGNQSVNAQYYHWDFGVASLTNDTSNLEDPIFLYPDTGTYSVTLVANPGYPCADTTVGIIQVYEEVIVEIENSGGVCFDDNAIDFEAVGDFGSGATFYWEFEGGTPSNAVGINPQGITFESLGTYNVTVLVTENICSDQATTTIQTLPRPQAYFNQDTLEGCVPLGVLLLDSSFSATDYEISWNLGDGFTGTGSRIIHEYLTPGTYDITLTIWTADGCVDTVSYLVENAIHVFPLPGGYISADPDTQFVFDPVFEFVGGGTSAVSCTIDFGDGTVESDSISNCSFEHFYTDTGNFEVIMTFTDERGCVSSDTALVRVEPEVRFWIPNAFTPNGDRINDTWGPKAFGFNEYELWVFDRWGKQMFHSTDPFEKWNGTLNNQSNQEPVSAVYSYRILARSVKNTVIRQSGNVTIVK